MTAQEIKAAHPLVAYMELVGCKFNGKFETNRCAVKEHKPEHRCVSVDPRKELWNCHDCKIGGDVIRWMALEQGKADADVLKQLSGGNGHVDISPPKPTSKIVATYDYTNENGKLLYQSVRLEPKSFRQRQPDGAGGWKWTMENITRVLYRLPQVLLAETVVCCEGEKDCDTMTGLGFVATCNVSGAGKWLASYSDVLNQKHVIVIPDNDKPGLDHAADIVKSLHDKAASVKIVAMPSPHKDATDYAVTFATVELAKESFQKLFDKTPHTIKPLPIYTIRELEIRYRDALQNQDKRRYDLAKFHPDFRVCIRPLVPGELVLFFGTTGIGKTAIMQTIARSATPLPTLLFELELPDELIFERFVQMQMGVTSQEVQHEYTNNQTPFWTAYKELNHILVCPESGLSPEQVERFIDQSELKSGTRPSLVLIDYIGLVRSDGKSRYEQVSHSAEQMKIIAKRTGTIIILASQIGRPEKKKPSEDSQKPQEPQEPHLYSSKDSGSLENSAGLVIGVWRPERDRLCLRILKNTRGESGRLIECNFDGLKMRITPRSKISDKDIPQNQRRQHAD